MQGSEKVSIQAGRREWVRGFARARRPMCVRVCHSLCVRTRVHCLLVAWCVCEFEFTHVVAALLRGLLVFAWGGVPVSTTTRACARDSADVGVWGCVMVYVVVCLR